MDQISLWRYLVRDTRKKPSKGQSHINFLSRSHYYHKVKYYLWIPTKFIADTSGIVTIELPLGTILKFKVRPDSPERSEERLKLGANATAISKISRKLFQNYELLTTLLSSSAKIIIFSKLSPLILAIVRLRLLSRRAHLGQRQFIWTNYRSGKFRMMEF